MNGTDQCEWSCLPIKFVRKQIIFVVSSSSTLRMYFSFRKEKYFNTILELAASPSDKVPLGNAILIESRNF